MVDDGGERGGRGFQSFAIFPCSCFKRRKKNKEKAASLDSSADTPDSVVCTSRDGVTRSGSKGVKEKGTNGRGWGKSQAQREKLVATGTSGLVLLEKHWFTGDGAPVGVCIGDLERWLSAGVGGR